MYNIPSVSFTGIYTFGHYKTYVSALLIEDDSVVKGHKDNMYGVAMALHFVFYSLKNTLYLTGNVALVISLSIFFLILKIY